MSFLNRDVPRRCLLALVLLCSFILRAWNLDWDDNTHLQPDERFWSDVANHTSVPDSWRWSEVLDPEVSTLNPRVFKEHYVYGTLPLWAAELVAAPLMTERGTWLVESLDFVGVDLLSDGDQPTKQRLRFNTGYDVTLVGRLLSALVDTATVGIVYLLGSALVDPRAGMLAALLQTFTVLHIQYAHFLGSEPWVAFFGSVTVLGAVKIARGDTSWVTRLWTSIALGLAVASKLSGIAIALAPLATAAIIAWPALKEKGWRKSFRLVEPFLIMGVIAAIAYRAAQPYDFVAGLSLKYNDRFLEDVAYLRDINSGGNLPWVQPMVGAPRLWHPLKQMLLWGMGLPLGLASLFGLGYAARRCYLGERYWAVPIAAVLGYFALVSLQFYAIIRYLQPAYPVLVALAASALIALWRYSGNLTVRWAALAKVLRAVVIASTAGTVLWAVAFVNGVYGQQNARFAAGDWMIENIADTETVSEQAWDDGLPWGKASEFDRVSLEPFSFGGDDPVRVDLLISGLDRVDYVVESSNKFYDSLVKTPARFPQMSRYYEALFDGSLGFELVQTFRNPPSLFGIAIDDSGAEEAFTVYDHPTVHIWKKTENFSVERATELLNPDRAAVAINVVPRDAHANAAMLTPAEYETQQSGSSFASVHRATRNSLVNAIAWFLCIQLAAFASVPWILRRAGRIGPAVYGFSKIVGLIGLGLPVWLLVAWGWFEFSILLVAGWLALMLAAGACGAMALTDQAWSKVRASWRLLAGAEAVFVAVFLAILLLRLTNPDLWHPWRGGEKPMELAYLSAVTGSTTLPPYDPWYAGGSLNYYYFGWFLLAVPARLLGTHPDIAFNLGVATFAAIAAVTVFSLAAMVLEIAPGRPKGSARGGLLAAILFLVVGNLDGARQLWTRSRNDEPLLEFDWWDPSRVNKASAGLEVTEFPSFTVLFGDLHPHFMGMGVFGLNLGLAVALFDRTRRSLRLQSFVLAAAMGVTTGVCRMAHTWDLPTVAAMTVGAVALGNAIARGPARWRVQRAVGQLFAVAAVHMFVTAPYRAHSQVASSGFHRSESVTNLDDFVTHWGLFLFVAVAYLGWRSSALMRSKDLPAVLGMGALGIAAFGVVHVKVGSVAAWIVAALTLATALAVIEIRQRIPSVPHLIVAGIWGLGLAVLFCVEMFTQDADIARLNTVFKFWLQVWQLFAVSAAVAIVWIVGQPRRGSAKSTRVGLHRLPTPAVASDATAALSGAGYGRLGGAFSYEPVSAGDSVTATGLDYDADHNPKWKLPAVGFHRRAIGRRMFAAGLVVLISASLIYPVLSVRPRQANRIDTSLGPSLAGHLWLDTAPIRFGVRDALGREFEVDPSGDLELVDWLRSNVEGRPTIVEAVGGAEYQWWGRISIMTGLPTVLGWRWHQDQQRSLFNYKVNERRDDVVAFYNATDRLVIDRFLRTYDVSYVIVGALEVATADPQALAMLASHPHLSTKWQDGNLAVYGVDKRSLAQARVPMDSIAPR